MSDPKNMREKDFEEGGNFWTKRDDSWLYYVYFPGLYIYLLIDSVLCLFQSLCHTYIVLPSATYVFSCFV